MSSPTPYVSRALTCAVVVALVVVGLAGPAGAAPSGSTGSDGTTAPVNLDALNEQYNLARLRLAQATAALPGHGRPPRATTPAPTSVQDAVRARSARLYQGAGGDGVSSILSISSVNELSRRTQYYGAAAKEDRTLLPTCRRRSTSSQPAAAAT